MFGIGLKIPFQRSGIISMVVPIVAVAPVGSGGTFRREGLKSVI